MDYYDNSASSSQNIGNINRKIQVRGGLFKIVLCHVCPPKTSGRMDLDLTVMYLFIHLLQENTNYSYPKPNLPIGKWSLFAAAWSPGLTAAVKLVLLDFLMENPRQKKFSALEWQQHVQQGHIPYRRDCRLCVQEMGQDRPHRRRHPGGGSSLHHGGGHCRTIPGRMGLRPGISCEVRFDCHCSCASQAVKQEILSKGGG